MASKIKVQHREHCVIATIRKSGPAGYSYSWAVHYDLHGGDKKESERVARDMARKRM